MTTTTELDDLFETNQYLAKIAREKRAALWLHLNAKRPAPLDVIEAYNEANAMLHKSATKLAMSGTVGTPVETIDGLMVIAQVGTIAEAMERGREVEVVLTQDGGVAHRIWHKPEDGDETDNVRYEVYTTEGGIRHGFIDRRSRKIVQTG